MEGERTFVYRFYRFVRDDGRELLYKQSIISRLIATAAMMAGFVAVALGWIVSRGDHIPAVLVGGFFWFIGAVFILGGLFDATQSKRLIIDGRRREIRYAYWIGFWRRTTIYPADAMKRVAVGEGFSGHRELFEGWVEFRDGDKPHLPLDRSRNLEPVEEMAAGVASRLDLPLEAATPGSTRIHDALAHYAQVRRESR